MLMTITSRHRPATDLGFLLHKHPDKVQSFGQSFGTAHVFYPEAAEERCTAALLLETDPQALLRARGTVDSPDFALASYVNDRPYAAASLFAVAVGDVFRTALKGRCAARPELPGTPLPLELHLPAVPCRGGPEEAHALFEPLGWTVRAEPVPLDPALPDWGDSRYLDLTLTGELRLADALSHVYVLLPVMDGAKHYWVAADEVDKLLRAAEGWLPAHPLRNRITGRYLARRRTLVREATARLAAAEEAAGQEEADDPANEERAPARAGSGAAPAEGKADREPPLAAQRAAAVLDVLKAEGARRVLDLGCGTGTLVARMLGDAFFERVTGVDASALNVQRARRRLRVDQLPEPARRRLRLFPGSAVYRDERFAGHDAVVLMEVVEHVDEGRLGALERVVFGSAAPAAVVVTTPNAEYNVHYEGLPEGGMRHSDHRFEWTRAEFAGWAERVAGEYGYRVRYLPVGREDQRTGAPTQMGVFTK
ncbi:3' terminal RNA ribose 2'-O-methyltransferase Hen1 [Nocardiopsis composta]|uniref:Small RNA 2'-O-methyltransferase n=1 Tax=Nocardiopsis composta TaxID=157465 RepID=A0A7W8VEJ0_9ACTN|nr:3' terminal RNA ribose 2'-O-methyltransferase Hen1 [Nocardiopsis composta]MBB5432999.1 3' terminal RNA ribose 2'-O-methyltransferase Hen1 [Nocardiopsis composta]